MPRKQLIRTSHFPYHVTSRSNNKDWFYLPGQVCWPIFVRSMNEALDRYEAEIHMMVLMSNHFHAMISTPKGNIDQVMRYFVSRATQRIQRRAGRINHVFGGRYHWTVLGSAEAIAYTYKYVYRNPVRAGITSRVEDYPFSSLSPRGPSLPLVEGFDAYWSLLPKEPKQRLDWLNLKSPREQEELIGLALRRSEFKFSTHSGRQAKLRALRDSYWRIDPAPFGTKSRLTP